MSVAAPKEKRIHLDPTELTEVSKKIIEIETPAQPKQVAFDGNTGLAYVPCMRGYTLAIFGLSNHKLERIREVRFQDQCVEVAVGKEHVYVTTSNFDRPPHELLNKLWILNKSGQKVGCVNIEGNWSKVVALDQNEELAAVSNWYSHDISFIDISDKRNPRLIQRVKFGEAPRGLLFLPNGGLMVSGFYSANIGILKRNNSGWEVTYISNEFDRAKYQGNMRHLVLAPDQKNALVTNLGRNMVHIWSVQKQDFVDQILVGLEPNTVDFINGNIAAISCRKSNLIYYLDYPNRKVVGVSEPTGNLPTGLCWAGENKCLVTSFESNKLELYQLNDG